MSRRHYIAAGGEVIPEGCVFLAPLSENDLKDHVSGESFVVDGQLAWNANEKAYLVTLGGVGTRVAHIVVPDMGINTKMTTVYEYKEVGSSNFRPACFGAAYSGGDSNTWHVMHYIRGNNNESYRYYGMLQHFSNENAELTNCAVTGSSFNQNTSVLTTPFGSTLINTWYKIALRVNASQNNVTVFIDTYKKDIRGTIPTSASCDIKLGAHPNNVRYLKGYMKDFRIWDVELTDEQIAAL